MMLTRIQSPCLQILGLPKVSEVVWFMVGWCVAGTVAEPDAHGRSRAGSRVQGWRRQGLPHRAAPAGPPSKTCQITGTSTSDMYVQKFSRESTDSALELFNVLTIETLEKIIMCFCTIDYKKKRVTSQILWNRTIFRDDALWARPQAERSWHTFAALCG